MEAVREKNYRKNNSTDTMESVESQSGDDNPKYEPSKNKRKRYNFQEKKIIVQEAKRKDLETICKKYGIGESTLRRWKTQEDHIIDSAKTANLRKAKKVTNTEELDGAMYTWLMDFQNRGIPVTGPLARQKALELNKYLRGSNDFKASKGWLERWKKRMNLRALKITGEKLSSDMDGAKTYRETFKKIVATKELTRMQTFNFDETGLYFKQYPTKTLAPKHISQVSGTKKQLERITVGACSNADGSLKLPLIVIGKSKNPRCFKNLSKDKLPVIYRNQKNAWMDKEIFEDWFINHFVPEVKKFLAGRGLPEKAILFVDNCKAHCYVKVEDIEVAFFPPNVTSLLQPLDQGILQTLKLNYQFQLVEHILKVENENMTLLEFLKTKITIKQAIFWAAQAWNDITSTTVYKGWRKLWPVTLVDAATQTECSSIFDLDSSTNREKNCSYKEVDSPSQIDHDRINELLQLVRKIDKENVADEDTVINWLENVHPVNLDELSNEEILEQVRNYSDADMQLEDPENYNSSEFSENAFPTPTADVFSSSLNVLYNFDEF